MLFGIGVWGKRWLLELYMSVQIVNNCSVRDGWFFQSSAALTGGSMTHPARRQNIAAC